MELALALPDAMNGVGTISVAVKATRRRLQVLLGLR
jgi:hypothetical protein